MIITSNSVPAIGVAINVSRNYQVEVKGNILIPFKCTRLKLLKDVCKILRHKM